MQQEFSVVEVSGNDRSILLHSLIIERVKYEQAEHAADVFNLLLSKTRAVIFHHSIIQSLESPLPLLQSLVRRKSQSSKGSSAQGSRGRLPLRTAAG